MDNKGKPTKGEMERRMRNAIVLVPKDKDYVGIYFDDKGLKLEATSDYAVVTTGFHRHVFSNITSQGVSRPYLYVRRFIQLGLENDCTVRDANGNVTRSYAKLLDVLDKKEDKADFNIAWYTDLWLNNIFHPLFAIGETETESFLVYETFLHNIARNKIIMSEKIEDMTNIGFVNGVCDIERKLVEGIQEHVVFKKKTDEEKLKEEIEAVQQQQAENAVKEVN
jgi:hypothetical protein